MQTMSDHSNLLSTKAIAKRFLVQHYVEVSHAHIAQEQPAILGVIQPAIDCFGC